MKQTISLLVLMAICLGISAQIKKKLPEEVMGKDFYLVISDGGNATGEYEGEIMELVKTKLRPTGFNLIASKYLFNTANQDPEFSSPEKMNETINESGADYSLQVIVTPFGTALLGLVLISPTEKTTGDKRPWVFKFQKQLPASKESQEVFPRLLDAFMKKHFKDQN